MTLRRTTILVATAALLGIAGCSGDDSGDDGADCGPEKPSALA